MGSLLTTACKEKVTYTNEFPYLPILDKMELESFNEAEGDNLSEGTYIVKNIEYNEVLDRYQEILEKDGWTISQDQKPANIAAQKGDHIVIIVPQEVEHGIRILIFSK
jgi:hypothetical protein